MIFGTGTATFGTAIVTVIVTFGIFEMGRHRFAVIWTATGADGIAISTIGIQGWASAVVVRGPRRLATSGMRESPWSEIRMSFACAVDRVTAYSRPRPDPPMDLP